MTMKLPRKTLRILGAAAVFAGLSGCVYGPPPPIAYAQPAPAYYAPGYYAAPAYPYGYYGGPGVEVDVGRGGYRRWR